MKIYLLVTMRKFTFSIQQSFKIPLNTDYLYVDGACRDISKKTVDCYENKEFNDKLNMMTSSKVSQDLMILQ